MPTPAAGGMRIFSESDSPIHTQDQRGPLVSANGTLVTTTTGADQVIATYTVTALKTFLLQ